MKQAFVEIIAKYKGCILCDLALGTLEEIAPEFPPGTLRWKVVDVGAQEGLIRLEELRVANGRRLSVPSIVINEAIAFDHIPDYDQLHDVIKRTLEC